MPNSSFSLPFSPFVSTPLLRMTDFLLYLPNALTRALLQLNLCVLFLELNSLYIMSFTEKLSAEDLEFFNGIASSPFSTQAVAFLNAYWTEIGSQAEFIFSCAWEAIKYVDMEAKGVSLIHLYKEGVDLDFDIGLRLYEYLCKFVADHKEWSTDEYKISQPQMMTAISRKKELRDKVDVNFDGRISMLEYLLYQYQDFANPSDFARRMQAAPEEHPEITKARKALEEVNAAIAAYEAEKYRLQDLIDNATGVKKLRAVNEMAQLESGPIKERLNRALITAEAAVRIATRKYGAGGSYKGGDDGGAAPSQGAIWWMGRDLAAKQARYGGRK